MSRIRNRFVISVLKQVHFSSQRASNHLLGQVPHPVLNLVINCQESTEQSLCCFILILSIILKDLNNSYESNLENAAAV